MLEFIREKWGDLIGGAIFFSGVAIAVTGAVQGNERLYVTGGSLMTLGAGLLKLKSSPPANGNGAAAPAEPK